MTTSNSSAPPSPTAAKSSRARRSQSRGTAAVPTLTAQEIRALRGEQTRAVFAQRIGVSELTIYRWEQPPESSHARRPRVAARRRLLDSATVATRTPATVVAPVELTDLDALQRAHRHIFNAQFDAAEDALIEALGSGALDHATGRAFAHTCTGFLALFGRNDARAALSSAVAARAEIATGSVTDAIEAYSYALAALVYATPDGRLFSAKRVNHYADRVRTVAPVDDTNSRALAAIAQATAAFHQGRGSALHDLLHQHQVELVATSAPVTQILGAHLSALSSALTGFQPDACRRLTALADEAAALGFAVGQCRALSRLAMASFMAGASRAELLDVAQRYADARDSTRLQPGFADLLMAAVEAEALHGLARFDDAAAVVDAAERVALRCNWPAADLLLVQTRLAFHRGGVDAVRRMSQAYAGRWQGLGRASIDATVRYSHAVCAQVEGDLVNSARLFGEARELARATAVRPWLELLATGLEVVSYIYLSAHDDAETTLRRLERGLERTPSPWFSALRGHLLGLLRAAQGRELEARQALEAAIATLELCGEIPETARVRRALAVVATILGADDADALFEETDREFERLGIPPTALQTREAALGLAKLRERPQSPANLDLLSPLIVAVQRLSVRGLAPRAVLAELGMVAKRWSGEAVTVYQLEDDNSATQGMGTKRTKTKRTKTKGTKIKRTANNTMERLEFGDGCGMRYCLEVATSLAPQAKAALRLLVSTAALALEVNALRALADPTSQQPSFRAVGLPNFVAASTAMRAVIADVQRLGRSRATVFIRGESGTGKEGIARGVHDLSTRASGPYVTLNCAAVPRDLFESQLFGHRKGAFTGATQSALGVIRAADGGTLFLDEIGGLPLDVQAKLLRFLENREVHPVGAARPQQVDVRVVAATHRDVEAMVHAGTFRQDLLFRLQVVTLRLPPLRTRRDDVLPLATHFLGRLTAAGDTPPRLSPEAAIALLAHSWPGNVRELRNVMERALAFSPVPATLGVEQLRLGDF